MQGSKNGASYLTNFSTYFFYMKFDMLLRHTGLLILISCHPISSQGKEPYLGILLKLTNDNNRMKKKDNVSMCSGL